tara:strand:+ start:267 stop:533 length:267 start_codon:yes stop_codon:yes gene_type:complete
MSENSDFNNESINEKFKILLEEDNEIKEWYEGLLIKLIILLPILIFLIGLFIVNRPKNITDILFILLYPFSLISIGLIILFAMRGNLK